MKVTINHKNYEWVINAHSFQDGVLKAIELHNRFGLIGRTYISADGKQTWI